MSGSPDYDVLARLHAEAFAPDGEAWSAAALRALAEAPGGALIGAPDGFALIRCAGGEAELLTLAVAPARRRVGTGGALLRRAMAEAQAMGGEMMFLEVAADNTPARALYVALGFVEAGRRRGYYVRRAGAACDALTMRRALVAEWSVAPD